MKEGFTTIRFQYGENQEIPIDIPTENLVVSAIPKEASAMKDETKAVKEALDGPIGTDRLHNIVNAEDTVAILSDCFFRPTPSYILIPPIVAELNEAGISDENITIVWAKGSHPEPTKQDLERKLGRETLERFKVVIHHPDDYKRLTYVGVSSFGTPIIINKAVAEADVKIGLGNVVSHYSMGFGGGAKIILPGVSSYASIMHNHSMMMSPLSRPGNIKAPSRQDIEEIARIVGLDFIVNTVLNRQNRIVKVFAGDLIKAHREAVKLTTQIYGVELSEKADVTLVTPGNPYNRAFRQGEKALIVASVVTKDGGTIIYASSHPDGIDPVIVNTLEQTRSLGELMVRIEERIDFYNLLPAYRIARVLLSQNVTIVSDGIKPEDMHRMGATYEKSIEQALQMAMEKHGNEARIIALPYGAITLPVLK